MPRLAWRRSLEPCERLKRHVPHERYEIDTISSPSSFLTFIFVYERRLACM